MIKVLDPGHKYVLLTLDGETPQVLTFVKRDHPREKYPGNNGHHDGTTLQSVIRALIHRVRYLTNQGEITGQDISEDIAIEANLSHCLYLLEQRAMRQHGLNHKTLTQFDAVNGEMCPICGHVHCPHKEEQHRRKAEDTPV